MAVLLSEQVLAVAVAGLGQSLMAKCLGFASRTRHEPELPVPFGTNFGAGVVDGCSKHGGQVLPVFRILERQGRSEQRLAPGMSPLRRRSTNIGTAAIATS